MKTLTINLATPYTIYIAQNLLNTNLLQECCRQLANRIAIITDQNLLNSLGEEFQHKLQGQGLIVEMFSFPAGEQHKTRATKELLEDQLLAKKFGRDSCFIALGGGVVSDLVGFIAATYCRGVPVIYVPTTLLAMVDASIGGKTGVNTPHGKNLIGSFTQPQAVFIDLNNLRSLPEKEWRNGIVEIIKHSIIADANLFKFLLHHVTNIKKRDPELLVNLIYTSSVIKKNIVEQDAHEQNIRQLLNFGHTIGHAIENIENYTISHGEAVAIGILVEGFISLQYGFLPQSALTSLQKIFNCYGLLLETSAFQNLPKFHQALTQDKKRIKNITRFALIDEIGKPHCHNNCYAMAVEPTYLNLALAWANKIFKKN